MRRLCKLINQLLFGGCMTVALLLALPRMFGISTYSIISGSMEPAMTVGTLIYVMPVSIGDIRKGDVISFVVNGGEMVATHRVTNADYGQEIFTTKGDANDSPDARPVSYEEVIGKVILSVPGLGYALLLTEDIRGKLIFIGLIAVTAAAGVLFSEETQKKERRWQ